MNGIATYTWTGIVVGILLLLVAIPYVKRIRHPDQKPFAAYMIFATLFGAGSVVLFNVLLWLGSKLGMTAFQDSPLALLFLLVLVFVPAVLLATWQAAKPPWRQGPPN